MSSLKHLGSLESSSDFVAMMAGPDNATPMDRFTLSGRGTDRKFYLPRLPREYYQGNAIVHWTLSISKRGTGWLNEIFHAGFREMMLHAASREGLFCPTYCLMPDHLHFVSMGLRLSTDQRNGMKFLREHMGKLLLPNRFQHQPEPTHVGCYF